MKDDFRRMYAELGVQLPEGYELSTEEPPLAVDEPTLRAYHNDELDFVTREEVAFLIAHYQAWWDADIRVIGQLLEEQESVQNTEQATKTVRMSERSANRAKYYGAVIAIAASLAFVALVVFRPGRHVTLLADGRATLQIYADGTIRGLGEYPAAWRKAAEQTIQNGVQAPPAYQQLEDSLPVQRSAQAELSTAIVYPYLTVVRDEQPELKWAAMERADKYRVDLSELGGKEPLVSERTDSTSWKVPVPLERGKTYQWRVYYVVGDETFVAPKRDERPAIFKVLSEQSLEEVDAEEKALSGSHLLLGLLYVREGLLEEAKQSWEELRRENPRSKVVGELLSGLQSLRTAATVRNNP